MNIAVCIKQTPDTEALISIAPGDTELLEDGLTWIINPHDEAAVEQALQLREKYGGTVTAVALGPPRVEEAIRQALAMGADEGLHLLCEDMPQDANVTAHALAGALRVRDFDLVLMGEVSIDQTGAQVPQRVAVDLEWPCVTAVEDLSVEDGGVVARRPVEQAEDVVKFALPGVIGINRRIGEPRYPSFRNIMQAKRKQIAVQTVEIADGRFSAERYAPPPPRSKGTVQAFGDGIEDIVATMLAKQATT